MATFKVEAIDEDEEEEYKPTFSVVNETYSFPSTLEAFGFAFKDGYLRHVETGEPFNYFETENPIYNRKRYQALGDIITEYVLNYLIEEGKLIKETVTASSNETELTAPIFYSEDAFTNPKLLIFLNDSGILRAGQWSRRLIIKDSLHVGTQMPYIKKAKELGYGILVLNANDHRPIEERHQPRIKDINVPPIHIDYVFQNFIFKNSAIQHIAVVGHGAAGMMIVDYLFNHHQAMSLIFGIALIDSAQTMLFYDKECFYDKELALWFRRVSQNWICYDGNVGKSIINENQDYIVSVSAGTMDHDLAPSTCMESIFTFLESKYSERISVKSFLSYCWKILLPNEGIGEK